MNGLIVVNTIGDCILIDHSTIAPLWLVNDYFYSQLCSQLSSYTVVCQYGFEKLELSAGYCGSVLEVY